MKRKYPFSPLLFINVALPLLASLFIPQVLFAGTEYSATSFNLIGPDGRVTAQLTSSVEGTPAIFFYDENHNVRLNLGIYPGGSPGVILMDKEGNASAILRLTDDGHTPVLVMKEGGVDKKIIGLGIYDTKEVAKPSEVKPAEIITTPIKSKADKNREYMMYGAAFAFGLVGAYLGGRVATRRQKTLEAMLQKATQDLLVMQGKVSTLPPQTS